MKQEQPKANPFPNPCPNSKNVGLHNWAGMIAPIFIMFKDGSTIKIGVGSTCAWSDWNDEKKRRMECWGGPYGIKPIAMDKIPGFTAKIFQEERGKGPSLVKEWGWHFVEAEGFKNYNKERINDGSLHWGVEKSFKTHSMPVKHPERTAAQGYEPEMPEFPLDEEPF